MSARPRPRRAPARGALWLIAVLFAASGAIRLGQGLGAALARTPEPAAAPDAPPAECPAPPDALAHALTAREAEVRLRETALEDRLAALALAETAIDQRLAALRSAEEELSRTLAIADGAAEEDLVRLTAAYEAMKPKDAAGLFTAMDAGFAAGFIGRMRPEAAAAILAGMPSEAAYEISLILAGRNAAAPTE